jgi:type IV pilus assembly protein PilX
MRFPNSIARARPSVQPRCVGGQQGASLIVSLLMLVVVLMLGMSAAQTALQGEKASRNDRDRQIALQAAEAALTDAERDIEDSLRSHLFASDKTEGFTDECGMGQPNLYLGLCRRAAPNRIPVWQEVDFAGEAGQAQSVPYGQFTRRSFQTGQGSLPHKLPRYIIELMSYNNENAASPADVTTYFYRITAIGFGMRETTQVVLQTLYRNVDGRSSDAIVPAGRFSWREIQNWQELRDAAEKN